ncbi:hypothetical protein TNCV_4869161 [Trichonephila clavipes]|nr:hypothetical protein TNCV_4869161 [Trichonephila clavipes]
MYAEAEELIEPTVEPPPPPSIPCSGSESTDSIFTRCLRRLLTVNLQDRNPIESSKLEATAADSIAAFILTSLQRST